MMRSTSFSRQAHALGLTAARRVPPGAVPGLEKNAWGLVGGIPVGVRRRIRHDGRELDAVHAALWPPLDLGLHVRPSAGIAHWFLDLVGIDDHAIGDEAFDRAYRIGAEELPRVAALLDPAVRAAIGEVIPGDELVLRDDLVALRGPSASIVRRVQQVTRVGRRLRRAAARVPRAEVVAPFEPPMRRLAASYGLALSATPLAAEGSVADLAMGVLVRRLDDGTRVLEVGCIVDPGMRYELEVVPREPAVEAHPPDLFEPSFLLDVAHVPRELAATHVVRASPRVMPDLGRILPPGAVLAIAQLQGDVDVLLQYGVLTLRRRLASLQPEGLEAVFDQAVAGARTIVPAVARGYRGGGRR